MRAGPAAVRHVRPVGILRDATAALLGRSTYQAAPPNPGTLELDSSFVARMRRAYGGQLVPPARTRPRWFLADLESAEYAADAGNLDPAAALMQAARKDGVLSGVLSTRTAGLVRLPKRFVGDADVCRELDVGGRTTRCVFDEMFPPQELALLAADGELLGVGVAELLPVEGRAHPVMVRLDPRFLSYVWAENRWYYNAVQGRLPITPGDGNWILHIPGGRVSPWNHGLWRAVGRAYIRKEHAALHKDNWEAKLANPARVAVAPQGSTEAQKDSWFKQVMAWGVNSVFGAPVGYDVKLLESNGRGWESFNKTIADQNAEMIIAVAGQTVTTDGGAGFQNSDIHRTIRADLIKATADSLAHTINTQGLPAYVALTRGVEAIDSVPVVMSWDVTPPKDRNSEATSYVTLGNAIQQLGDALRRHNTELDVAALCERFAVPVEGDGDGDGAADAADGGGKPALRLIPGGAGADGAPAVTPDQPAQDTALNGAQIASLLEIVAATARGEIPRDAGVAMIKKAFLVDDATAEALMGSVGAGFTPTPAAAPGPGAPPPAAPTANTTEAA